jgi:hypothetical protein
VAEERFIGGASLPSKRWGRINATMPLASLTLDDAGLLLRLRGRLGRSAQSQFAVRFDDSASAYPLRGRLLAPGVGLDLLDGRFAYFYSWRHGSQVLRALGGRGVTVDHEPRSAFRRLVGLSAK